MDQHFINTPLEKNLPVIFGLINVFNSSFLKYESVAIMPYSESLCTFPEYIQQLSMESNGKSVGLNNKEIYFHTGPVVFGEIGTNGQHRY